MAVLKPRERLVYFRVSEDEFHQFISMCEQEGARSVSDLARSAVQRLIAGETRQREDQELAPKVAVLEKLIGELNSQLEVLTTLLRGQQAGQAVDSNGTADGANASAGMNPRE